VSEERPPSAAPAGSFDPQRLLRVAGVTREVLEEARRIGSDAVALDHLKRVLERIRGELHQALPPELYEELDGLTPDVRAGGSLEELTLAHAEILGWLGGLFQGTQLALQLQALQARQPAPRTELPGSPPAREQPDSTYL
jgi:hypothetical protein